MVHSELLKQLFINMKFILLNCIIRLFPLYALIEFYEYREKCMYNKSFWKLIKKKNKCFPIIPISKSFIKREMKCYRKQSPLVLGHLFFIHKVQESTVDKIIFFLNKNFTPLLTSKSYLASFICHFCFLEFLSTF